MACEHARIVNTYMIHTCPSNVCVCVCVCMFVYHYACHPQEAAAHCLDLSVVLRGLERHSEAIAVAEVAISRAPSSHQLWLAYGLALSSSR